MSSSSGDDSYSLPCADADADAEAEAGARTGAGPASIHQQMALLEDKLQRTTKFLQEIQALSPVCQEPTEELKEKQVLRTSASHIVYVFAFNLAFS